MGAVTAIMKGCWGIGYLHLHCRQVAMRSKKAGTSRAFALRTFEGVVLAIAGFIWWLLHNGLGLPSS